MSHLLQVLLTNLVIVCLSVAQQKANLDTLRQVQIIFRHGARSIDQSYPTDPFSDESLWAPGFSQLTNLGKLQGYNLGVFLRERYDGFVGPTYNLRDVYVLSSDFVRTMQTASSMLSGFYLPNELPPGTNISEYLSNQNQVEIPLPWKSVPVHTIPEKYDNIVRQNAYKICPRCRYLFDQLLAEDVTVQRKLKENDEMLKYLNEKGQLDGTYLSEILTIDTLYVQRENNMTMPDWTAKVFESDQLYNWFVFYYELMVYTEEMKRLKAGPLIEKLINNFIIDESLMEESKKSRQGRKLIHFFSGHDVTLAGTMGTLGIYNKLRPPYASALMLELHQRVNATRTSADDFYVEIHYRNDTTRAPYVLQLPGCSLQCPLREFIALNKKYIPVDWAQECELSSGEPESISTGWIIIIVLVVWLILFTSLQFWVKSSWFGCIDRKKRRGSYSYIT